jgi:hypothetical protein
MSLRVLIKAKNTSQNILEKIESDKAGELERATGWAREISRKLDKA